MIRFDSTIPVAHAWLQQEGQPFALDITWDGGGCYFGIPFRSEWIEGLIQQREAIGSSERQVLNYRCQFSLRILRDGLQPGMVRGG
jgi:hypothetical protein